MKKGALLVILLTVLIFPALLRTGPALAAGPQTLVPAPAALFGHYNYYRGTLAQPGHAELSIAVSGELSLERGGRFEDDREIGDIVANASGTFTVDRDTLTLQYDDGSPDFVFTFLLGRGRDSSGTDVDVLTLSFSDDDGSVVSYTLLKAHQ